MCVCVCVCVSRFEPQGWRFTNFHYYYYNILQHMPVTGVFFTADDLDCYVPCYMCEARVISTPMGVHLCTGSYGRSVSWWNSGATQAVTGDQYPSGIQGLHWKSVTGDRYPCGSLQAALAVTGEYPLGVHKLH